MIIGVSVTTCFWTSSFIAGRYNDPEHIVPSYMPFETDTWAKYLPYSVLYFYDLYDEARGKTPHRVQFPRDLCLHGLQKCFSAQRVVVMPVDVRLR